MLSRELKLFSGIHILLKVFHFEGFVKVTVLRTKVQVGVIFDEKYFYRCLSEIYSNLNFNSITIKESKQLYGQLNKYMQSLATNIL